MMRQHVEDMTQVIGVNVIATIVSLGDVEQGVRIVSLALAALYTAVKIWQALRGDRAK